MKLGELCSRMIQPFEFIREYEEDESNSARFLRAANIIDGELLIEPVLYVAKVKVSRAKDSKINPGDVLITRTGAYAGATCAVRGLPYDYYISSHTIRLIPKTEMVEPRYLEAFLISDVGKASVTRLFTGAAQKQLQLASLATLPIPLPTLAIQRKMVEEMERARELRRHKLAKADALLASLDAFLLDHLDLTVPDSDNRTTYAIRLSAITGSKQIGADYFHPKRMNALQAIQTAKKAKRAARLDDVADFIRDIATEYEPEEYLGLAGVQSQTGELADTNEEPGKGQAFCYKENDVLFARLRPYLNKVWRAERNGVCSTEFHVIRIKEIMPDLLPDYLAAVLRSFVVVAQTKHMMTGNTHPRLANEDVVDLLIPIPKETTQREIVDELRQRRLEARRLHEEAAREWEAAKARFEARLLGGERAH